MVKKVAEASSDAQATQPTRSTLQKLLDDLAQARQQQASLERERASRLEPIELTYRTACREVTEELDPQLAATSKAIADLEARIAEVAKPRFWQLVKPGTKTIALSNGEISHRSAPPALKILNKQDLLNWIRRHRQATNLIEVDYKVNTKALKAYLDQNPRLLRRLRGAVVERGESIVIRLHRTQADYTVSVAAGSFAKED